MRMFVWEYIGGLTDRWHSGGGLMVVAETVERAREIAPGNTSGEPDAVYELEGEPEEKVFIFPDSGCC